MIPAPDRITLAVADPVSADVQAICGAVKAACEFLCSTEGQAMVAQWRADGTAFRSAIGRVADWFKGLFKLP